MASHMIMPPTAPEPIEGELNVLTMSNQQILDLIHVAHVSDDETFDADSSDDEVTFDADSLFVVVKNILKRTTHIVDNVLLPLGQQHLENLEEKVSRASFDPLLSTLKQLSSEMACKAPGVEIAHKTTMSLLLEKLLSYSWSAKAVLILATFALDYEDFAALAQLHSSDKLVESVNIPKHVSTTLKHLDLQKYGKTIGELNKIINDTLVDIMESISELKKLSTNKYLKDKPAFVSFVVDDIMVGIYWIIITVVACTTQMSCITSDEDKIQDLLPLAEKVSETLCHLKSQIETCHIIIEETEARRKLMEFLPKTDEIMDVFKILIFATDDVRPLIDGSMNQMVSIDMLKKKNVLLFISSLDISDDTISNLMPIYDGIREKGDQYKIVWIPIVEQWNDDLQKKFEMLRSKMPWYIVQYFSPMPGIKYIKEVWHFNSKPIVVVMNPTGDVENQNAFGLIQELGMTAFPFTEPKTKMGRMNANGPYAIKDCKFHYGGQDNTWNHQFCNKVNAVVEDPIIKKANISIKLIYVENKPNRWAKLTKRSRDISVEGMTIMKVLAAFQKWKVNVQNGSFESCFKYQENHL